MGEPPILGFGMPTPQVSLATDGSIAIPVESAIPDPPPPPPPPAPILSGEIYITNARLLSLPTSGTAWNNLESIATGAQGTPNIADMNNKHNTRTFAKALYAVRTSNSSQADQVRSQVMSAIDTENGGRTLPLGRNLMAYILAADLVDLTEPDKTTFRSWVTGVRSEVLGSGAKRSLIATHEIRPNNWGTHCFGSRIAAAVYLDDASDLNRTLQVFRGWLGDRSSYNENSSPGFVYAAAGDLTWQCTPSSPVGINPIGCTKSGHNIDGVLPDDQRRCGTFVWPPCLTNYAWEGLQGIIAGSVIAFNIGFDVWNFENRAIVRALDWLHDGTDSKTAFPAVGDDKWMPWIVNFYAGTSFPTITPTTMGKNMGFSDWTHA